jgi:23S rRNA (guanosine2251-2'-O)-methyltransferase
MANPDRTIHRVLAHTNALSRLQADDIPNRPETITSPQELDKTAGIGAVHQGLVVLCDPLPESGLEDFPDARLLVVLDQITDPHNIGAILRSAAAFGADALVLTDRNSPAADGVLAKAASGALEHVPLIRVKNLARALDALGQAGIARVGLDSGFDESIYEFAGRHRAAKDADQPTVPVALVLGAEGAGLRRLTREKCDHLVSIRTTGAIASLNVSNAAAIALHVLSDRA